MSILLGIDIGTSSTKALLLDSENGVIDVASQGYEVIVPQMGYAEQNPGKWWNAVCDTLGKLKSDHQAAFEKIAAVGLSGQMHGLVAVNANGKPVRPAIIWLDQRSNRQVEEIKKLLSEDEIKRIAHNDPYTGFAFPSLMWIRENEPEHYRQIDKVLMPKDYIRYRMTGAYGADASDASSTTCFDVRTRDWSEEFICRTGLERDFFPDCHESTEIAGEVSPECERQTGLRAGIPVIFGGGDQQCQCIGNGAYQEGIVVSNIGTGGEIASYIAEDIYDPKLRTHTFCHAINKAFIIYGATLCSGMSLRWLKENILKKQSFEELSDMAAQVPAGSEGIVFLPHLTGERTPYMNPKSKGIFFGLRLIHDDRHFARAVMEGVAFGLKGTLDIFDELGIGVERIIASGGAATSPVWLQIQADIFGKEVVVSQVKEQACLGAGILAALGTGIFRSAQDSSHLIAFDKTVYEPSAKTKNVYDEAYQLFVDLYENNKDLFERTSI